jgi:tetratricopeptide (TPR) repeat protein
MLANLAHHLSNFEDSRLYAKMFLKKNPRNIDILYLQSLNLINLEERKDALEILSKIKQIEPYNVKVNELIEKLKLEIVLENNFSKQ